ncbi:MAG: hypothetical protein H8D22_01775 [Candidatus Cloacimonetes bacterium]|nr:hypothetical protein [Candidatus Cloacimonadota bacterium]
MEIKKLIAEIKENIEKTANIKSIFGDTKKVDNVSIIPVASIQFQGGGGGGFGEMEGKPEKESETLEEVETDENKKRGKGRKGKGGGMGMKVDVNPVGYIEIKDDNAKFVEIIDKTKLIIKGMKVFMIVFILHTIRHILRRKKK